MNDLAQMISLGLTPALLILSFFVIKVWGGRIQDAIKSVRDKETLSYVDWLLIGITISFVGTFVDNLYWGIAWGSAFVHHPSSEDWFSNGVYSNIPFRQTCGIIAAYCHLRAFLRSKERRSMIVLLCFSSGALFILSLCAYRTVTFRDEGFGNADLLRIASLTIYLFSVFFSFKVAVLTTSVKAKVATVGLGIMLLLKCADRLAGDYPKVGDVMRDLFVLFLIILVGNYLGRKKD